MSRGYAGKGFHAREVIPYQGRVSLSEKENVPCPRREGNLSLPKKGKVIQTKKVRFSVWKGKAALPEKEYVKGEHISPK